MNVAFKGSNEVEQRLLEEKKLSPQEVRDLMPWMRTVSEGGMRRLRAELDLQTLQAIQNFEGSSSRLTGWLIVFTGALVVLALVTAYYTLLLVRATPTH